MLERAIPSTGEMLPVVGCGTWQTFDVGPSALERAPLKGVLEALFEASGILIDTPPMYGKAEGVVGGLLPIWEGQRNRSWRPRSGPAGAKTGSPRWRARSAC